MQEGERARGSAREGLVVAGEAAVGEQVRVGRVEEQLRAGRSRAAGGFQVVVGRQRARGRPRSMWICSGRSVGPAVPRTPAVGTARVKAAHGTRSPGRVCASSCAGSTPSERPMYTRSTGSGSTARRPRSRIPSVEPEGPRRARGLVPGRECSARAVVTGPVCGRWPRVPQVHGERGHAGGEALRVVEEDGPLHIWPQVRRAGATSRVAFEDEPSVDGRKVDETHSVADDRPGDRGVRRRPRSPRRPGIAGTAIATSRVTGVAAITASRHGAPGGHGGGPGGGHGGGPAMACQAAQAAVTEAAQVAVNGGGEPPVKVDDGGRFTAARPRPWTCSPRTPRSTRCARRQRGRRGRRRGGRARRDRAVLVRHRRRWLHGHPHPARPGDDDRRSRDRGRRA